MLALWSFGKGGGPTLWRDQCGGTSAPLVGRKDATMRQQLREWCYERTRTVGAKRSGKCEALDVQTCVLPLLR